MDNRLLFDLVEEGEPELFESLSLELVELKRTPQNLAKSSFSLAQLFCLPDPLPDHLPVGVLFHLETLVGLELLMRYYIENHQSETENIRLESTVSHNLGTLYPN